MEVFGGEVGVRGVVFVEAACCGVAKEDAAAAVGLEAVLVRVDNQRINSGDDVEGGASGGVEVGAEGEVASVGGVDVDAELVLGLKLHDLVERVDGADGGGPEGDDYGTDQAGLQGGFEGGEIHAAVRVGRDFGEGEAEDGAD